MGTLKLITPQLAGLRPTARPFALLFGLLFGMSQATSCAPVQTRASVDRSDVSFGDSAASGAGTIMACTVIATTGVLRKGKANNYAEATRVSQNAPLLVFSVPANGYFQLAPDQAAHGGGGSLPLFIAVSEVQCPSSGSSPQGMPPPASSTPPMNQQQPASAGQAPAPAKPANNGVNTPTSPTEPTRTCSVKGGGLLNWFPNATCTRSDGSTTEFPGGARVTIKQRLEPGSPDRYYEVKARCVLLADKLDRSTCQPAFKE